jgi:hypothetical protein
MPEELAVTLSVELKQQLMAAKAPVWKKVLWWCLVVPLVLLGVMGVLYWIRRKGSVVGVKEAVRVVKNEISKSDLEAKIRVAEAARVEQVVIDKLKEIKEIDDEKRRLDELNQLL